MDIIFLLFPIIFLFFGLKDKTMIEGFLQRNICISSFVIGIKLLNPYKTPANIVELHNNGPGDQGSISGQVIPKAKKKKKKKVLDISLLSTQHYKVCIKDKMEQSREKNTTIPYTPVKKLLKREHSDCSRQQWPTLLKYHYKWRKQ